MYHIKHFNGHFKCLNCGKKYSMSLPASENIIAATTLAFERDHANCSPVSVKLFEKRSNVTYF